MPICVEIRINNELMCLPNKHHADKDLEEKFKRTWISMCDRNLGHFYNKFLISGEFTKDGLLRKILALTDYNIQQYDCQEVADSCKVISFISKVAFLHFEDFKTENKEYSSLTHNQQHEVISKCKHGFRHNSKIVKYSQESGTFSILMAVIEDSKSGIPRLVHEKIKMGSSFETYVSDVFIIINHVKEEIAMVIKALYILPSHLRTVKIKCNWYSSEIECVNRAWVRLPLIVPLVDKDKSEYPQSEYSAFSTINGNYCLDCVMDD